MDLGQARIQSAFGNSAPEFEEDCQAAGLGGEAAGAGGEAAGLGILGHVEWEAENAVWILSG